MSQAVRDAPVPADQDDLEGSDRGRLEISRTVLRRIAEHAADMVSGSARVRRRVAGVDLGEQGASARLSGPDRELRIRLDVALRYPTPVHQTVRSIRESVQEELGRIANCQVHSVDVTVSALVPANEPPRVE